MQDAQYSLAYDWARDYMNATPEERPGTLDLVFILRIHNFSPVSDQDLKNVVMQTDQWKALDPAAGQKVIKELEENLDKQDLKEERDAVFQRSHVLAAKSPEALARFHTR